MKLHSVIQLIENFRLIKTSCDLGLFSSEENMTTGANSTALISINENAPAVEVVISKTFGLKPGSRSCPCRGCYLNCLYLEAAAYGQKVENANNACDHLVNDNGVNVMNKNASRLGRIPVTIWKQALGIEYVYSLQFIWFYRIN